MEYAVQAWSPYMVKDIQILEKVQQRATKCVTGLKNKTYQQRLKILGIPSLELRRKRGDLIETYTVWVSVKYLLGKRTSTEISCSS